MLLLADDVDQLDATSLALLLPLTISRAIFLVATVHAGRPLPAVITSLLKDEHLRLEQVPVLLPDEVATLLHRVLDGPVERLTVDRLATASAGTSRCCVRSCSDRSSRRTWSSGTTPGDWASCRPRPSSRSWCSAARRARRRRTSGPRSPRSGGIGRARRSRGRDGSQRPAQGLEGRGLIDVTTDRRRTRVTLAHPVYGDVIRRRMNVLRERDLKRALADRLEACGARRREDVIQLALWRIEGGGHVDTDVLLSAGQLALVGRDAALASRFSEAAARRGPSTMQCSSQSKQRCSRSRRRSSGASNSRPVVRPVFTGSSSCPSFPATGHHPVRTQRPDGCIGGAGTCRWRPQRACPEGRREGAASIAPCQQRATT